MVGQEHILKIMSNSLTQNRVHHAYLLCGTRGVGKTTSARIFAKCLNCETGITDEPCNVCDTCKQIDAGNFLDLIEIDAASRTKVEDTRELLDNVQYAPSSGRYKVYLIDEVHMLSGHSFNALLKTLEEPPEHVKFLLATTDPQKLPITVLSRCLKLQLRMLTNEQLISQLKHILESEKITSDENVLNDIATAAQGSMRDALSLLDQAIAMGGDTLKQTTINTMLGTISSRLVWDILAALSTQQNNTLFNLIEEMSQTNCDFEKVCNALLTAFYQVALHQTAASVIDESADHYTEIKQFADQIDPELVQLYYQIILKGKVDLPLAPNQKLGFEMLMLRLLSFSPENGEKRQKNSDAKIKEITKPNTSNKAKTTQATDINKENWHNIISQLKISGMTKMLATHCTVAKLTENELELSIAEQHQGLNNDSQAKLLAKAIQEYLGRKIRVRIRAGLTDSKTPQERQKSEQKAQKNLAKSSLVKDSQLTDMMKMFDASIDTSSIENVE